MWGVWKSCIIKPQSHYSLLGKAASHTSQWVKRVPNLATLKKLHISMNSSSTSYFQPEFLLIAHMIVLFLLDFHGKVEHSSEKRGLNSIFWPRETLQNLLCLCKKKTPVVFFIFHFEQLWALALSMPWSMWPKAFFQPYFAVLWEIFPTVYFLLFLFYTYLVNNNFKRIVIFLIMKSYS